MVGKSQVCNQCHHLKIQCSLVLSRVRQGVKCKAESDMEEMVQLKELKLVVKVLGMRVELTTWEVLLEHSELLRDLWELFGKQLKQFEKQLEEVRGLQQVVSVIRFTVDEVVEWMSWMEEGSGSGNDGARSI